MQREEWFHLSLIHIFNELIVLVVGNAWVAPAHIQRIVEQLLVVCSDVQHDWQGVSPVSYTHLQNRRFSRAGQYDTRRSIPFSTALRRIPAGAAFFP